MARQVSAQRIKSPERELLGVVLLAAAALALLGLATFDPQDPCLGQPASGAEVHNVAGRLGAYIAGALYGLLGLAAYFVPAALIAGGVCLLAHRYPQRRAAPATGSLLLVVSTCGLLGMAPGWQPLGFPAGGWLGGRTAALLISILNTTGSWIVLATLLVAGLVLAFKVSPGSWYLAAEERAKVAGEAVVEAARRRREERGRAPEQEPPRKAGPEVKIAGPIEPAEAPEPEPPAINGRPQPAANAEAAPRPAKPQPLPEERQLAFEPFIEVDTSYELPPLSLLAAPEREARVIDRSQLIANSRLLEEKLRDFGVEGRVVEVTPGPVVTMYEFEPAPGVKINRIANLSDDLALALKALSIRIVAPIPKKGVVGIEIPNHQREQVLLQEIVTSEVFQGSRSRLTVALGKDIVGHAVAADLARMPHLLIAGATGAGKSVALNSMICSILLKARPEEVRLLMIDPKRIELSVYEGIPHLLHPVLTDAKKATAALRWAVGEMEERYRLLARLSARGIDGYNAKLRAVSLVEEAEEDPEGAELPLRPLPYIVIVIDELSDLMMVSSREVEESMTRLAHMARAAGIHLIVATQRPSVDVLTGVIKANFPTRISFRVSSKVDSRTVIDTMGAEMLLGAGDMLFLPPGTSKLQRIHGAYVSETEIGAVVDFLKGQKEPVYDETIVAAGVAAENGEAAEDVADERYDEAVELVVSTRQASISMVQRRLRVGYNRAARMIEMMEREGIVSPSDGVRPREVLVEK